VIGMVAKIFIWFLVTFLPFFWSFAVETVKGRVFVDLNGDKIYDVGERGIAGAKISDGEKIVLTNSEGQYTMEPYIKCYTFSYVCLLVLNLFTFRGAKTRFWRTIEEIKDNMYEFPLQEAARHKCFCFIHLSNSHGFWIFSPQEVINWALKKLLDLTPKVLPVKFIAAIGDEPCDCPTGSPGQKDIV